MGVMEKRFTCHRCHRRVPWSQGCDDGRFRDLCDWCWVEITEGPFAPEIPEKWKVKEGEKR